MSGAAPASGSAGGATQPKSFLNVDALNKVCAMPDHERNAHGSASGAGSGDFHEYRNGRRREQERLDRIEKDAKAEREQQDFLNRKAEREAEVAAKHAKKSEKRKKKKMKAKEAKKNSDKKPKTEAASAPGGAAPAKSAEGGAGNDEESSSDEGDNKAPTDKAPVTNNAPNNAANGDSTTGAAEKKADYVTLTSL